MKLINLFIVGCLFLGLAACGGGNDDPEAPTPEPTPTPNPSPSPTPDPTPDNTVSFYKGADISWVTEMEKDGKKFYYGCDGGWYTAIEWEYMLQNSEASQKR